MHAAFLDIQLLSSITVFSLVVTILRWKMNKNLMEFYSVVEAVFLIKYARTFAQLLFSINR